MLLDASRSQLIAVDMQERLIPAINEAGQVLRHAGILVQAAHRLGVPITVTEQYPKGLGPTVSAVAGLVPPEAVTLPKMTFSAARDPDMLERFEASGAADAPRRFFAGPKLTSACFRRRSGSKRPGSICSSSGMPFRAAPPKA